MNNNIFPESLRVIYQKNPLTQVLCQLKFPAILKIESELPVRFQEKINIEFPNYSEKLDQIFVPSFEANSSTKISQSPIFITYKNHTFISDDEVWIVNLTREFVTLTSLKYQRWEIFLKKLEFILDAIKEIYAPKFMTRVGLRYINVIHRSNLNLNGVPWDDLLMPHITGFLGATNISNQVKNLDSHCVISLNEGEGQVQIRAQMERKSDNSENVFVIDNDFFIEQKIKPSDIKDILINFNSNSSQLIRWCISDRLHYAMEPNAIDL